MWRGLSLWYTRLFRTLSINERATNPSVGKNDASTVTTAYDSLLFSCIDDHFFSYTHEKATRVFECIFIVIHVLDIFYPDARVLEYSLASEQRRSGSTSE